MYKVIEFFTDLQDNDHPYKVGDIYPRKGKVVSSDRLSELSGKYNKRGKPVIEEIKEKPEVKPDKREKRNEIASEK